ncbi:right-handed parallel beta-helix repeat-containing protein, partial [bacterium]|nr:right-handed parallel beta-helix repeat-containing protein [bacterium]
PIPISGTLTGLKLYRSLNADCELITGNIYQTFAADVTQYIDANVEEGNTYYYRLTGLLTSGETTTESVVSSIVGVMSDNAGIVRVLGTVRLQEQSDHAGVKIYFEKVSPSAVADSLFTAADGKISIVMKTGIYNIHLTKDGYQPVLLGNRFLSANTQLDTIAMRPGGTKILTGNIEGTLLSSNLHFIDGDVTIPAGKVLTIQPGTTLKFRGDYTFKVEGQILAEGNADSHIVFTSGMPSPLEGDWKRITLTNAQKSVFKYCEFYFAENGFLLNNSDGSTFDHCTFDRFLLNAIGVEDGDYNNNDSLIITNNIFRNTFNRAVNLDRGFGSVISDNDIMVTDWGIVCNECDGSEFSNNFIYPSDYSFLNGGIHSHWSEGSDFSDNTIRGYKDYGIYFYGSSNSQIISNSIDDYNFQNELQSNDRKYALRNDHEIRQNCTVKNNTIEQHAFYQNWGITSYGSIIDSNYIKLFNVDNCTNEGLGIRSYYDSKITNNIIFVEQGCSSWGTAGIYSIGQNYKAEVSNNTVYCRGYSYGFQGNGSNVHDNRFLGWDGTSEWWGLTGDGNLLFEDNYISGFRNGASLSGQNNIITDNEFIIWGENGFAINGGNNTIIRRNTILMDGGNDKGMRFYGGNVSDVFQNSIVSSGNPSGTGIFVEDNAHPVFNSNLIYGFSTGINAGSAVYDLKFNNISNYQTAFAGSGLPNQAGQIVTVNNNLAPSDIYSNILLDPQFVNLSAGDISLKSSSPAINAGDIDSLDVDGTIADIGAKIYNFGFVPQNLIVRSTGGGWVEIGWTISATDSLTGCKGYYKLSTGSTWTPAGQTGENYLRFTGLTNNVSYDFAVAAVYPSKESLKSRKISEKPGLVNYVIDPRYLSVFQQTGQTSVKNIAFINNGTKDLTFTLTGIVNSGILSTSNGVVAPGATVNIADTLKGTTIGVKTGKIKVVTNNYANPLDSICILQVVGSYTALNPVKFTPPSMVDNEFYFVLDNGSIDSENLQTGDEVGIFDGEECVGAGSFNGSFPMIITCYGAEGGSPGFMAGDSIIVQLYDASKARYATVNMVSYSFGNGYFVDGGFAKAGLQGSVYQSVNIPLTANRFNLISSYLYPRYPNATTLFSAVPGLKIAYEDNGAAYIPQYNINTIGDLDITEGYHLFIATTDRMLVVSGLVIDPVNFPLTLANNRFNSIGYLLSEPADVTAIFTGIVDYISIVQDDDGGVWIPELNINTLGSLQPLSGYQIFVTGTEPIVFTYPDLTGELCKKTGLAIAQDVQPKQYRFNKTGLPYTIVVTTVMMDGQELTDGDEIGVFWNELCAGATVYQRGKTQVLSAWKGDDELDIPGYKAGDGIHFRAYSQRFVQEFELSAHFAQPEQSRFEGAAYAVVSLQGQPGLIPERYALHQNYPNPFNSRTVIPYDVPREADVSLVIYDLLGKEVVRIKDRQFHQPGKYRCEWNGMDRNGVAISSGIYFVRMISQDYQKVQKLILMK